MTLHGVVSPDRWSRVAVLRARVGSQLSVSRGPFSRVRACMHESGHSCCPHLSRVRAWMQILLTSAGCGVSGIRAGQDSMLAKPCTGARLSDPWLRGLVLCAETGVLLPNNQRQHRTSHAPKDVLPLRICANYCAPCCAQRHRSCTSRTRGSTTGGC